jgi:hypothetical protein
MLYRLLIGSTRRVPFAVARRVARSRLVSRTFTALLARSGTQQVQVVAGPLRGARLELDLAREKAFWS